MTQLDDLVIRGSASVEEVSNALGDLSFARLSDDELVTAGNNLLNFGTILDAVAQHPGFYKKIFDQHGYYHGVKGSLTPRLVDSQVQRLMKLRSMTTRHAKKHPRLATQPHEVILPDDVDFRDVQKHFNGMDIYDGRKFKAVLEGVTLTFHCPEIVPENAKEAFGPRWYNVKQFHADYEHGLKDVAGLKEDGRRGMFMEGTARLVHYLRRK